MNNRTIRDRTGRGRWKVSSAAAVLSATLLIAWSPAATAATARQSSGSAKTTLVVEDNSYGNQPYVTTYEKMAALFEKSHPNVHVVVKSQSFDVETKTGILELTSSNVPAVFEVNQGYSSLGQYVKDKLLVPLDGYAAKYDWTKLQSPALLAVDGRQSVHTLGTGSLWGVSTEANWVGVMYNKKLLAKLGQQVPTTFASFQNDLKLAKGAGIIPFAFGDQGPDANLYEWFWFLLLAGNMPSLAPLRNLIDGVGSGTWATAADVKAAATFQNWEKAGYFPSDFQGLDIPGAQSLFVHGKALFYLDGNWDTPAVATAMGTNIGMFPLPSATTAHGPEGIATGGEAWTIPVRGPDHALAAQYINFMISPAAEKLVIKYDGTLPASSFTGELSNVNKQSIFSDEVRGYKTTSAGPLSLPFPDWATADMATDIRSVFTSLVANRITPRQAVDQLQSGYAQGRALINGS